MINFKIKYIDDDKKSEKESGGEPLEKDASESEKESEEEPLEKDVSESEKGKDK
jgi:hypothetical protein